MIFRKWSEDEAKYVKENYLSSGATACAAHLNRTRAAVCQRAWMVGAGRRQPPHLTRKIYQRVLIEECDRAGLPPSLVMSRTTSALCSGPKFRTWRRLHDMGYSYPQIGKRSGRDHTAVMSGAKRAHEFPLPERRLIQPAGDRDLHMSTFMRQSQMGGRVGHGT